MNQSKGLNIALWIVQALLATAFIMSGFMKVMMPIDELAANGMTFVNSYSETTIRFIGICEILGALGLIIPSAFRFQPILTPVAAAALATVMVLAASYHIQHDEPIVPNVVLFTFAAFVAWGRFKKAPIESK